MGDGRWRRDEPVTFAGYCVYHSVVPVDDYSR